MLEGLVPECGLTEDENLKETRVGMSVRDS